MTYYIIIITKKKKSMILKSQSMLEDKEETETRVQLLQGNIFIIAN